MRYTSIIVTHYGGPDALQVVEEECPEPKDDSTGTALKFSTFLGGSILEQFSGMQLDAQENVWKKYLPARPSR